MCVLVRVVVCLCALFGLLVCSLELWSVSRVVCVRVRLGVPCLPPWWFVCGVHEVVHVVCVCVRCDCLSGSVVRLTCVVCGVWVHMRMFTCLYSWFAWILFRNLFVVVSVCIQVSSKFEFVCLWFRVCVFTTVCPYMSCAFLLCGCLRSLPCVF